MLCESFPFAVALEGSLLVSAPLPDRRLTTGCRQHPVRDPTLLPTSPGVSPSSISVVIISITVSCFRLSSLVSTRAPCSNSRTCTAFPLPPFIALVLPQKEPQGVLLFQRDYPRNDSLPGGSSSSSNSTDGTTSNSTDTSSNNSSNFAPAIPLPFFAFALAAIALFVIVVAFVLLRICMRNRRLRRMGIWPEGPIDRLLGGGAGMGNREIEDNTVPPKLWQAKIVPPPTGSASIGKGGGRYPGYGQSQNGCWDNLVPIAASLPTSLFVTTGAAEALEKEKAEDQSPVNAASPARDAGKTKDSDETTITRDGAEGAEKEDAEEERIPGSVNVSVLIAMPSPPKNDGEELPELMIGTAAVPIYTRVNRPSTATQPALGKKKVLENYELDDVSSSVDQPIGGFSRGSAASASSPSGYFSSKDQETSATSSAVSTAHPTKTQLIALFRAAQAAKERKREMDMQADKPPQPAEAEPEAEADGLTTRERPDTAVDTVRTSTETPTGHARPFAGSLASASGQSPLHQMHALDDSTERASGTPEMTGDPLSSTAASLPARPAPIHA